MKRKKNIFVLGLDDFNLKLMSETSRHDDYHFHSLLNVEEIVTGPDFDIPALLKKARGQLHDFPETIDAIVGYWDFPSVALIPILRKEFGLIGPSLESVLKCEHKYWSRKEQKKVIPAHIPHFILVNPADDQAMLKTDLPFPFWIKPVTAHSSMLGFYVDNQDDYIASMQQIAKGIEQFATPVNEIMSHAVLPADIQHVHGGYCIAEEIISTDMQCTLEGYVFEEKIEVYGVVDSVREEGRSSFARYQYPSQLPEEALQEMKRLAQKIILQTGLQYSPFNIEFFYDSEKKLVTLLEINARISKSHSPLFQKVDGIVHNEVMLDIGLGKRPSFLAKQGRFKHAAKFMPRIYDQSGETVITQAPDDDRIREIEKRFPGTEIELHVKKGMQLSELLYQDSYSYEWATIFMGANDQDALLQKYEACKQALDVKWEGPA